LTSVQGGGFYDYKQAGSTGKGLRRAWFDSYMTVRWCNCI